MATKKAKPTTPAKKRCCGTRAAEKPAAPAPAAEAAKPAKTRTR